MTTTQDSAVAVELITVVIDGFEVSVPKGTLIIRAAEKLGIQIPRFCDHPLLDPVGACRQCLVDVEINGRAFPKPQASCTIPVEPNMIVKTQLTSPVADKAQKGVMELLLGNHPLDCPVCDKGGECPLQNQAMSNGRPDARLDGYKRTFEKPINISSSVLLDRERCVLCARCTRFSEQIASDPFITLNERGALQQVGIYENDPFKSYFSGNTVQICPVGALTGASYRFRARPFDLVSTPSACEHCASGCDMRTDVRRGKTLRRLAGDDPSVNEEWNCDKGRWAFKYVTSLDRLTHPLVRNSSGELVQASWPEALAAAAAGLKGKRAAVLTGGRVTTEDAYGYSKFARIALGTNDIDYRARVTSDEERDFLAAHVAGSSTTYRDIDTADHVALIAFEPEEESPIVFLRLNKNFKKRGLKVSAVATKGSIAMDKLKAEFIKVAPGAESTAVAGLALTAKSVILVGERASESAGLFTAVAALAAKTGAKIAYIPRRAGERGALEAGALGNVLPGGRPVADAAARVDIAAAWGIDSLPATPGRTSTQIIDALTSGDLDAVVVGGVDAHDLPHSREAIAALKKSFVVSLEIAPSSVTAVADVVLPVAAITEKSGSFLNWEGRARAFDSAVADSHNRSDVRILSMLADALGNPISLGTVTSSAREFNQLGSWDGSRVQLAPVASGTAKSVSGNDALLSSWRRLLDMGTLQKGEDNLAGTRRPTVAVISPKRAASIGVATGQQVRVSNAHGSITIPVLVEDIHEDAVWIPRNSFASQALVALDAVHGDVVTVVKA
ncbi:NADH-quinone oxidoreductase subunit G [Candidatus Planktophila dulcis]|uniref:NADH-quinone oxidoreductase subunit G n=1 Tax=Candidatus Planktophila dulcis TaxID=1884914 RepID=UPI000BAC7617|nr:NADH-quinone oxidoreductase subunit G [Candidatus Planktophila dulcis]ASY21726.1 NADH-quinone oxidoreductase subunit G [Candidatus Planktophila dulcis]